VSLQVRRFAAGAENATEHPEPLEWLLAGWHAVGLGARASLIGLVWYWLAWAVVWGARYGAHAVGWTIETTPVSGGTYASVFFAGIFALAIPFLAADDIPSKLRHAIRLLPADGRPAVADGAGCDRHRRHVRRRGIHRRARPRV
jgi:hypothetical protein